MSQQGPQPRAEDSGDGAEEPLQPRPARGAFARCIRVAVRREGLAEVGLHHLLPGHWWDLHHRWPALKAVGPCVGALGEGLRSPGYSQP